MFCPGCGQQQISDEVRFCSRCGALLSDVAEVIANKGISPYKTPGRVTKKDSRRRRGIKQGAMILLVGTFLVVPILAIASELFHFQDEIVALVAVISFMGGILRMIYATMFEPRDEIVVEPQNFTESKPINALPPKQSIPAADYIHQPGSWQQTTNNLVQPPSVTEQSTKLLDKKELE